MAPIKSDNDDKKSRTQAVIDFILVLTTILNKNPFDRQDKRAFNRINTAVLSIFREANIELKTVERVISRLNKIEFTEKGCSLYKELGLSRVGIEMQKRYFRQRDIESEQTENAKKLRAEWARAKSKGDVDTLKALITPISKLKFGKEFLVDELWPFWKTPTRLGSKS